MWNRPNTVDRLNRRDPGTSRRAWAVSSSQWVLPVARRGALSGRI